MKGVLRFLFVSSADHFLPLFMLTLIQKRRVGGSPAGASKHEFDGIRVDRVGTGSQSDAACQLSLETSAL